MRGSSVIILLILNTSNRQIFQFHVPTTVLPGKNPPVSIEKEADWAWEQVWTFRKRESLASSGYRKTISRQSIWLCCLTACLLFLWDNRYTDRGSEEAFWM